MYQCMYVPVYVCVSHTWCVLEVHLYVQRMHMAAPLLSAGLSAPILDLYYWYFNNAYTCTCMYCSLTKRGPWVVHLTLGLNRGWADIRAINVDYYQALKAVQIVRDMVGQAFCTSVNHCAAV